MSSCLNKFIIYKITFSPDPRKIYIGKTGSGLSVRWKEHCQAAFSGSPSHFHRAIRKYGASSFYINQEAEFEDESLCFEHEIRTIQVYKDKGFSLYNMTNGGEGASGWHHDEPTRKRIGDTFRGVAISQEHKDKISKTLTGRKRPIEVILKVAASRKGKHLSKQTIQKIQTRMKKEANTEEGKLQMVSMAKDKWGRTQELQKTELIGERFEHVVIVGMSNLRGSKGQVLWEGQCDCGNTFLCSGSQLRKFGHVSCGKRGCPYRPKPPLQTKIK